MCNDRYWLSSIGTASSALRSCPPWVVSSSGCSQIDNRKINKGGGRGVVDVNMVGWGEVGVGINIDGDRGVVDVNIGGGRGVVDVIMGGGRGVVDINMGRGRGGVGINVGGGRGGVAVTWVGGVEWVWAST